jgi:hypothetical protein
LAEHKGFAAAAGTNKQANDHKVKRIFMMKRKADADDKCSTRGRDHNHERKIL